MSLSLIVTNAGRAALINAQANGTAPVVIATCGVSASALTPVATATALPGEIKRIATLSGSVPAPDIIHVTVRDETADAFTLRSLALYLADGTLFALYGQTATILEKTAQAAMFLAFDVKFADVAATSIAFGDTNFLNPPATETVKGVAEIASQAETDAGTDDMRIVTPKKLASRLTSWLASWGSDLWRASNDGSGSGLDADLLDGQQGSWYADILARLGFTPANKAGDSFTGTVFAPLLATDTLILPKSGTPQVVHYLHQTGGLTISWNRQSAGNESFLSLWTDGSATINSARIWTGANDGAGSGLDADILDGQHGSWYADILARLGWTPVNRGGDTMVGKFTSAGALSGDGAMATTASDLGSIEVRGNGVGAALMTFHRPGSHASYFGLDTDNRFKLGGWSMGANAFEIWHAGNDGAGSGSDADMLDGQQGSWYADIIARLGWTPVRQGGGVGQLVNAVFIGWSGSRLKASVDFTDQGNIVFDQHIADVWRVSNDGSGSGMDSDLWRGQTPGQLLASMFSSGYDPATGVTWRKWPDGQGGFHVKLSMTTADYNGESQQTFPFPFALSLVSSFGSDVIPPTFTGFYDQFTQVIGVPTTSQIAVAVQGVGSNATYPVKAHWWVEGKL